MLLKIYVIVSLVIIGLVIFLVSRRAKLVNTEYKEVNVKVIDVGHIASYVTPLMIGKVMTMQVRPAVYRVTVEYNDSEYVINDSETYSKYKDKIGHTALGVLKNCTYSDGTVSSSIVQLS